LGQKNPRRRVGPLGDKRGKENFPHSRRDIAIEIYKGKTMLEKTGGTIQELARTQGSVGPQVGQSENLVRIPLPSEKGRERDEKGKRRGEKRMRI